MKLDTAIKIKMSAMSRVSDVIYMGVLCKQTSSEINMAFIKLKGDLPKDTPQWLIYYFNGIYDTMIHKLYMNDLEFCYLVNGKLYSIVKTSRRYYGDKFSPKDLYDSQESSGHYWIDSNKPFFNGEQNERDQF